MKVPLFLKQELKTLICRTSNIVLGWKELKVEKLKKVTRKMKNKLHIDKMWNWTAKRFPNIYDMKKETLNK